MARTSKDTVSYFPHEANASSGDTLTVLQSQYGNNGYAFWFKLLEKLASTEGHCLDLRNPIKWQIFIAKMGIDEITTVEILKLLVEMQAIDKELWEAKLIWCQNLVDNVADVYHNRKREIPQKPITTRVLPITTAKKGITTKGNPQSKVKESKLNKTIEVWDRVLKELKSQVSSPNYKTWLEGTRGLDFRDGQFIIAVPSEHVAEYLRNNQRNLIEKTLIDLTGQVGIKVLFQVERSQ